MADNMTNDEALNESDKKTTTKKKATKTQTRKTKAPAKTNAKKKSSDKPPKKRERKVRQFPAVSFEQAAKLGESIVQYAPGETQVRRLTILDKLELAETSQHAQHLITHSGQYGITKGSYKAEWIKLTSDGETACSIDKAKGEQLKARFNLAIEGIPPFKVLFNEYSGKRLPAHEFIYDFLDSTELNLAEDKSECVDLFITNVKELGLLRPIGGAATLITLDHLLDEFGTDDTPPEEQDSKASPSAQLPPTRHETTSWDTICFYVTPIGDPGSAARKHSDLFKSSIIEPAMMELGLTVIRADEVETAGMITSSILEHLRHSKLVIADLSLRNPNVYYEIALRHACRLPIVQIRQEGEDIPFDINQVNTLTIDNTDLYSFVPQIESFRSEVTSLARAALKDPGAVSNPVTTFYPKFFDA